MDCPVSFGNCTRIPFFPVFNLFFLVEKLNNADNSYDSKDAFGPFFRLFVDGLPGVSYLKSF